MLAMSLNDIALTTLSGDATSLGDYAGRAILVVNVASKCGLTPQYTALEQLARDYGDRGLTVIGVPCNQFMGQEPGSADEIQTFCSTTYGVTFPLLGIKPMVFALEVDADQVLLPAHVDARNQFAIVAVDADLGLRRGKAGPHESQACQRLVRRLGAAVDKRQRLVELPQVPGARVCVGNCHDLHRLEAGGVHQGVDTLHSLGGVEAPAQVECGSRGRGHRKTAGRPDLAWEKRIGVHDEARRCAPVGVDDFRGGIRVDPLRAERRRRRETREHTMPARPEPGGAGPVLSREGRLARHPNTWVDPYVVAAQPVRGHGAGAQGFCRQKRPSQCGHAGRVAPLGGSASTPIHRHRDLAAPSVCSRR